MRPGRLVFSTEPGAGMRCIRCGWPAEDCRCSKPPEEPVPALLSARLRLERKGRSGKTVTRVESLPDNSEFLEALARDLKKACGTGGRAERGAVELQGDQRERLRPLLESRGWRVKE